MNRNLRVPLSFIKKDLLNESSYKLHFIIQFAGIFISTLSYFFLSRLIGTNVNGYLKPYGGDYFSFVLIGFAFANYLQVSLQGFSSSIRDAQLMGIMEILLVTDTRLSTIIISSSLYKFLFTSLRVILFLFLGAVVFSVNLSQANYPVALLILALTIASFSCVGILSASFIMVFKKGDPVAWLFNSLSWLLGGVYYPISILPDWLQKIAKIFPITYSLEAMRMALLQGHSLQQLWPEILALIVFTAIMLPLSLMAFQMAVNKAKSDGTLIQY